MIIYSVNREPKCPPKTHLNFQTVNNNCDQRTRLSRHKNQLIKFRCGSCSYIKMVLCHLALYEIVNHTHNRRNRRTIDEKVVR